MDISIRHALNIDTGEVHDAHVVFADVESGQKFRHYFYVEEPELVCVECGQNLHISTHPYGGVFFKHYPGSSFCILKDSRLTAEERVKIEQFFVQREGPRHKSLKHAIANYLKQVTGVVPDSISVDDHFISNGDEKRRPDICFEFEGKKIVFEIQISRLPGKYIFKRHEFYRKMGMYLIWILDDFDVHGQDQTAKDIKYLSYHQNYFFFADNLQKPSLVVQFKKGFNYQGRESRYKWNHEFVGLTDLKYDPIEFQSFYLSFRDEEKRLNDELLLSDLNDALKIFRRLYETDNTALYNRCDAIVFDELDHEQFNALNRRIGGVRDSGLFFRAIADVKPYFLIYMLRTSIFENNLSTKNAAGSNLLEELLRQNQIFQWRRIVKLMFERGYELSSSDRVFLNTRLLPGESKLDREKRVVMIYAYNHLRLQHLTDHYERIEGAVLVILSAKFHKIIGQGFSNFLEVANNAVRSYRCWTFIERAMKHYGILDSVIALDRKGTFASKRAAHIESPSSIEESLMLAKLFPEVVGSLDKQWIDGEIFNVELVETTAL